MWEESGVRLGRGEQPHVGIFHLCSPQSVRLTGVNFPHAQGCVTWLSAVTVQILDSHGVRPDHGHREGHAKTWSGGQLRAVTSEDEAMMAARALLCGDCGKFVGAARLESKQLVNIGGRGSQADLRGSINAFTVSTSTPSLNFIHSLLLFFNWRKITFQGCGGFCSITVSQP